MNSRIQRKKRAQRMIRILKRIYPDCRITLRYQTHWQLLVAVVLSAQCTDAMVNRVTKKLFVKYRTIDDCVHAGRDEFERAIKPIGLYKTKAKNILASARIVKEKFRGRVPNTMEQLVELPGVGKKTANVVLGHAFGVVEGIPVDTHVRRFALKFDLTDAVDPAGIEQDLMELLPKKEWLLFSNRMIAYGREVCPARRHDCRHHPLTQVYPPAAYRWPRTA